MGVLFPEESRERGRAFQPRPDDIIIAPYAKSGTTWLQQIVHSLRSGGNMDFDEISTVVPWIETAYALGGDLEAEQVARPRVYKSHLSWHDIPQGGRYIVSFRNPQSAMVSLYRFFAGWFFERGSLSLDEIARWRMPQHPEDNPNYWYHLASWWGQGHNPDVLLLCYEDMRADHPGTVRQVAAFMGLAPDDPIVDIAIHQSTREFMLAHKDQYDEKHMQRRSIEAAGLPPTDDAYKITAGGGSETRLILSDAVIAEMAALWQERIAVPYGLADYEALRQALRQL